MLIGVPKEIKNHEYRVGLTPDSVMELVAAGQQVIVETQAGNGIGFSDDHYRGAGAEVVANAEEVFARADLIVKVKEPQPNECRMLREGQTLFTYLHLAADPTQAQLLMESGATCIAYETVTDGQGRLPLLAPMSEVAGRLSVQAAAHHLEKAQGGSGVLLGGVPGVPAGKVLILGGGVAGTQAAHMAVGLGAEVTILDRSVARLRELDDLFGNRVSARYSTRAVVQACAQDSDVIIGGVLIPGAAAPKLVSEDMIRSMGAGSVVVDIAIDQGGCFATSKPTTHAKPTYQVDGVIHYCVTNMPGAVARTSTLALNNATLPHVLSLATQGVAAALEAAPNLAAGVNVRAGEITHPAVMEALGYRIGSGSLAVA